MIQVPNEYFETESCVYKLYYGDRYVIVKGKTLAGSIFFIEKGYAAFIAAGGGRGNKSGGEGHKQWDGVNTYYFKFYTYIYDNPNLKFTVDVLLESNNAYQLLKAEQLELDKYISDKKNCNNNVQAYIPKFKNGMYGWIKPTWVLNYKKFLKRV